jgi:hypothetical protein
MKFEVLTADSVKRMAVWDVTLCSCQCRRDLEEGSKVLVPVYQTTWQHIPENCTLIFTVVRTSNFTGMYIYLDL